MDFQFTPPSPIPLFIIAAFILLLWMLWENITQEIYKVQRSISYEARRGILLVILGAIITFGIDAMISADWLKVILTIIAIIIVFFVLSSIEKRKESKRRYLDWQYRETLKEVVAEAVEKGIKKAKEVAQTNKDKETKEGK